MNSGNPFHNPRLFRYMFEDKERFNKRWYNRELLNVMKLNNNILINGVIRNRKTSDTDGKDSII